MHLVIMSELRGPAHIKGMTLWRRHGHELIMFLEWNIVSSGAVVWAVCVCATRFVLAQGFAEGNPVLMRL